MSIAALRAAILSTRATQGGPELPGQLRALAQAFLEKALTGADRASAWRAADVLGVLVSIGRADGHGIELFLDDECQVSFIPRAIGPHPWSTLLGWFDAYDVTMWSDRSENYPSLVRDFRQLRTTGEPPAIWAYAASLCRRAEDSHDEYDGPLSHVRDARNALDAAGAPWRAWLRPRLEAWDAYGRGDTQRLEQSLIGILDGAALGPSPLPPTIAASAILSYAALTGLKLSPADPRLRLTNSSAR